jgi:hypothetical protein
MRQATSKPRLWQADTIAYAHPQVTAAAAEANNIPAVWVQSASGDQSVHFRQLS